ncbi:hypothetical protein CMO93_05655 [Candidatus Woesearchaeota archaeon]|nr:hypothetical protein [Candidatus Woesearchaeota archaeon]|tara:strand:+ start:159 stop:953 length:795 start_codon:yes stop_codon:yes gene_type:complete
MRKRGQISIFILFAVIILISIGLLSYIKEGTGKEVEKSTEIPLDLAPVKNYFDTCIKTIGEDALVLFGLQGGNLENFESQNPSTLIIKTFFEEGKDVKPSKESLENSYSRYLETNLPTCLDNANFQGFDLNLDKVTVKTKFLDSSVDVKINYPLTIRNEGSVTKIQSFDKKYPVRMGHIYDTALNIVNKLEQNPKYLDYSDLLAYEDNDFFIMPHNENLYVISVQDDKSIIRNTKYNFMFTLIFESNGEDETKKEIERMFGKYV